MITGVRHVWFDLAGTLYKETTEFNEVHDHFRYSTYAQVASIEDSEQAKAEFLDMYKKYGSNSAVFRSLGKPSDFWMKALDDMDFTAVLEPDAEVTETLKQLKDTLQISLFTNFHRERIDELLEHLKITPEWFSHILTGDDIAEPPKRPPAPMREPVIKKPVAKVEASEPTFEQLGNAKISKERSIIISKKEDGSIWVNEKLSSDKFKGFTTKGFGIPVAQLSGFVSAYEELTKSTDLKRFDIKLSETSSLVLHNPDDTTVDVRYFITTPKYTGFTKKGIRLVKSNAEILLDELKSSANKLRI